MSTSEKTQSQKLKDLKAGKFQDCYLIYCRKSTDEADNQKNSINVQRREIKRFAKNAKLPVADISLDKFCVKGVVSERHSAFKERDDISFSKDGKVQYQIDRPKFLQMVQYLNAGYFKGVICLCADRISRNKADNAIISKLKRRNIDFRFVMASYEQSSSGSLHFNIDELFSNYHSVNTSHKVSTTIKQCRSDGRCTYRAPIGYLNEGSMDNKPVDPERGPIIAAIFQHYASGGFSLSDLARYANEQGMTTLPMRRRRTEDELLSEEEIILPKTARPITENHISRILRNQFYTGRVIGPDGDYVQSVSHEALVDDKTFNRVQELLGKKTVSVRYDKLIAHPLRGFVRCANCNRVYTPYEKKGILYFNTRCVSGCPNSLKNCNFNFICDKVRGHIDRLYFTEDEIIKMEAQLSTDLLELEDRRACEIEEFERSKRRIRADLAYLRGSKLQLVRSGAFTPEEIAKQIESLEREYDGLIDKEVISEAAMRELMSHVTRLSELLQNVVLHYDFAGPAEKEKIIKSLFSELTLSQDGLETKVQPGLEPLEDRLRAVGDPIAWISELYRARYSLCDFIEMMEVWEL